MRCRTASSRAQSFQHLWISDSQLSEAFHRFARVSNAQHRRHGSNVPGPLEARRRLARRRMGMMTLDHSGGNVPPVEEAGVLFGFGRTGPPIGSEFAKAWKYQAPFAPQQLAEHRLAENRKKQDPHWLPMWSDGSTWDVEQEPEHSSIEQEALVNDFLYVPPAPAEEEAQYVLSTAVEESQTDFEQLLEDIKSEKSLDMTQLRPVLQQLRSTVEITDGERLVKIIRALNPPDIPRSIWTILANFLKRKILCMTISCQETLSIFQLVLARAEDWQDVSFTFASEVGYTGSTDALLDVFEHIVRTPEHKTKIEDWLRLLLKFHPAIRDSQVDSASWKRFYALVSETFKPSDPCVAPHLGGRRSDEFAQVLLDFYLPVWINATEQLAKAAPDGMLNKHADAASTVDDVLPAETQFRTMDYGGSSRGIYVPYWNSSYEEPSGQEREHRPTVLAAIRTSSLQQVKAQLNRFLAADTRSLSAKKNTKTSPIVKLVALLHHHKLPYIQLLDEVFAVYLQEKKSKAAQNLFLELRRQTHCAIPTSLAGKLVHHFISLGKVSKAYYIFHNTPTLPLLPYAELLLKLIARGKTHGDKIFEMLQRYHPEERLPLMWRQHRRLDLKPEHINLVHDVAYDFASSEHLSPRTAFRRVWECFRFLRDRRAPLQPLISRALVKAGISRALKEQQRLSKEQVKYIISVVEQVEGSEVAQEVDRMVWDAWKWSLERQWALSLPKPAKGPEGQGRFYANKRRVWTKGGGRIYMPFPEAVAAAEVEAEPYISSEDAQEPTDARDDVKAAVGETDPTPEAFEAYEPMVSTDSMHPEKPAEPMSSLTEMDEVIENLHDSRGRPEMPSRDGRRIIDSQDEEPPWTEMDEVLGAHDNFSTTEFKSREHVLSVTSIAGDAAENTSPMHVDDLINAGQIIKLPSAVRYHAISEATVNTRAAIEEARQAYKVPTMNMRLRLENAAVQDVQDARNLSQDRHTDNGGGSFTPPLIRRYKTQREHRFWMLSDPDGEAEMLQNDKPSVIGPADTEPAVVELNEVLGATSDHIVNTELNDESPPVIAAESEQAMTSAQSEQEIDVPSSNA